MAQNGTPVPDDPSGRHAHDAARFTALIESARPEDWVRPSPVAGWTALDVVKHLIEWPRGFLKGAGIELGPLDIDADPAAAWKRHVTDVQDIIDNPAGRVLRNPNTGDKPVDEAIDQFYTVDIWMHSWDFAKALGREPELGQERCRTALADLQPIEQALRDSGHYGPAVPVADDASPQDKLAAFIGRDPAWKPES
ncbi:maleylpyruvate isomerase family mycothiol-dependent enzyme [Glycomyces sp. YM15]|uniref:maleylpyruvate isomerase family mycothiol-dependent enzyme n=1 Tax=Glycomyces sp. YM15 TaxID=2800446 RepID=UPI0019657EBB|nr:maleylpyruvate isomerase family mycothiol-dependent enzyme [Glycomyces sp. YM15]